MTGGGQCNENLEGGRRRFGNPPARRLLYSVERETGEWFSWFVFWEPRLRVEGRGMARCLSREEVLQQGGRFRLESRFVGGPELQCETSSVQQLWFLFVIKLHS